MIKKPADTEYPIHELLAMRWSPRAFLERPVEKHKLLSLFEAARWAPSSYNEQPWRFVIAEKEDPAEFDKMISCLLEQNQKWAKEAPVLLLTFTSKHFAKNGKPNPVNEHDIGLAMGNLTVQAANLGLVVHQMQGIKHDQIRELYNVPEEFDTLTAAAIGYQGDLDRLHEDFHESEKSKRSRKPLKEIVFQGTFGNAAHLVEN